MEKSMEDVSLTYTGIMRKGNEKVVHVRFSRNQDKDYAEGVIPNAKIEKSKGFSEKELASLRFYLKSNEKELLLKAKEITGLRGFFR